MKKYLIFAASALALASCSSDDFLGENPGNVQNATTAIKFDGNAGKISRATSNTGSAPEMLGKEFKIYGVKSGATSGTDYNPVFKDYLLWYDDANTNTTTNKSGWEYVGTAGKHGSATLNSNQTIKFWDYASADYRFVAGAPSTAFTFTPGTNNTLESATITCLSGHITANTESGTDPKTEPNPVYVAKPVVVSSDNYKQPVTFTFVRHQTKVRVGIYETIPGYKISSISFYPYEENSDAFSSKSSQNIILTTTTAGYFKGGSSVSGKINYEWSEPKYTFEYETTDLNLKQSKNWYGGKFANGVPATVSTEAVIKNLYGTDADMESNGYFTVLPTPSTTEAKPILIKCDYTLTSDDGSGETIEVTGATAAIPKAYSKWDVNTRYTYLFKISDNTNGYTGDDPTKAGLFPITFDAVVAKVEDKTQGTTTIVKTPSITTYQDGSVTDKGIEYKPGKEIKVTVTNAETGEVKELNTDGATVGSVAVYKFTDAITEAEIQVKGITGATPVTGATIDGNVLKFTPESEGYYAIQYLTDPATPAVYTYKVVYVKAAPTETPAP